MVDPNDTSIEPTLIWNSFEKEIPKKNIWSTTIFITTHYKLT
jgi:hypothetical protein